MQAPSLWFASSDRPVAERHPPLASHESRHAEGGGAMTQCPVCDETQLVFVAGPLVTWCYYCGAQWVQDGSEQHGVTSADSPSLTFQPT